MGDTIFSHHNHVTITQILRGIENGTAVIVILWDFGHFVKEFLLFESGKHSKHCFLWHAQSLRLHPAILKAQKTPNPGIEQSVQNIGPVSIGLGVICLALACITHRRELKSLEKTEFRYESPFPLALVMAMAIALFGIYTIVMILLKLM